MADKKFLTKYAGILDPDKYARILWIKRNFDRYETYWKGDMEMAVRNARMYWHINYGQWPMHVVEKLRSQGRRPPTFPVIPDKIETLVGNFIQNTFDIRLEPRTNQINSLTLKMQDIITSDKHNLDWDTAKYLCLLDSFIKMGAERMVVTDLKDPFGNLSWESLNPRHLYLCPAWKSPYNRDLMDYMVFEDLNLGQIKNVYPKSSPKLNELYRREKMEGVDYGIYYGAVPRWRSIDDKWSGKHRVIEFHHVQNHEYRWEWDKINNCWFPETRCKANSEEDRAIKMQYVQQMGLSADDIVLLKRKKRVKFIEAICPDIDKELFLDKGKDIIQTNNCNIYPLGIRYYGQYQGMVDRVYDLQIGINKGEMNIQDVQMRAAKGAFLLDRALSGGDPEIERDIETSWNDPAARIWVDEYATERLPKGGIVELPGVSPTPDMYHQTERYYELTDRLSKVPAVQDARTESNKESGKLFKFKMEAGILQQKYLLKFYETHERDKIEAAITQAKITYAGVPRTFPVPGTKDLIRINEEAIDISTGRRVILDDISALSEMNVVLIPSRTSVSVRDDIKQTAAELLPMSEDPLVKLCLEENIAMASELAGDDGAKEQIEKAFHLAKTEAAISKVANIKSLMIQISQSDKQLQALKVATGMEPDEQSQEPLEQQMSYKEGPQQQIDYKAAEGTPMENENVNENSEQINNIAV